MNQINLSRRAVLMCGVAVATSYILSASSIKADDSKADDSDGGFCTDPNKQRKADKSFRESLEYTEKSSDPIAVCAACAFFQPVGDNDQCGKCAILNGTVDAAGHCLSWSPKG